MVAIIVISLLVVSGLVTVIAVVCVITKVITLYLYSAYKCLDYFKFNYLC